jgi:hypothetical protein
MTRDFIDGERKRTVANLVVECFGEGVCPSRVRISWRRERGSFVRAGRFRGFFCALPSRARSSIYSRLLVAG